MASSDVSVVIRSCGRATLLKRAFGCLLTQTVPPAEVIVVGIGALGVEAAAPAFAPPSMRMVPVVEGRIRGGALNDGVRASRSSWVAFLDDDDTWSPTFLEEMVNVAVGPSTPRNCGAIICRTEAVYERVEGDRVMSCGREPFNSDLEQLGVEGLFQKNRFTINAALWRRTVFDALGGFSETLPLLEDWDFNLRAAARFQLVVLPRMLAFYHLRPPSDPMPNTRVREHSRIAARLQYGWFRNHVLGPRVSRSRQVAWLARAWLSRCRARFGNWRRWIAR